MRADEYVVEELLKEKEKNKQLQYINAMLSNDVNEYYGQLTLIRSLCSVEEMTTSEGYRIVVRDIDGSYCGTIAYSWTKDVEKIPLPFFDLLDALGLTLPSKEPNVEELEQDQELVAQAMEKAKELQKKGK